MRFFAIVKSRQVLKSKIRNAIRQQVGYLRRNLKFIFTSSKVQFCDSGYLKSSQASLIAYEFAVDGTE